MKVREREGETKGIVQYTQYEEKLDFVVLCWKLTQVEKCMGVQRINLGFCLCCVVL